MASDVMGFDPSGSSDGQRIDGDDAVVHSEVLTGRTPLAEEWERLAAQVGASPFTRPWYIDAWHRAFGSGPLRVLTARRDHELVGVLPLQSRAARVASPTNDESPQFEIVATDVDIASRLVDRLLARRPRSVNLTSVVVGSTTAKVFRGVADRHAYRVHEFSQVRSPWIDLTVGWEHFQQQRLSKNRRQNLRRKRRRLEEQGSVSVELIGGESDHDLPSVLMEAIRLEAAGWKGQSGTAIASDPRMQRFYTEVVHEAARRDMLRLMCLRLDGQLLAFDLGLRSGDTIYNLKVSFDENYRKRSPGFLLTYEAIRAAFDTGCTSYQLTGEDDWYKRQWTDLTTDQARLLLVAPTLEGRVTSWGIDQASRVPEPVLIRSKALARRVVHV